MTNLTALEATLKAIQSAYDALLEGNLSKEEMDLLVENSQKLYERSVILRYKLHEAKVFDSQTEQRISDFIEQSSVESETNAEPPLFDFTLFDASDSDAEPVSAPQIPLYSEEITEEEAEVDENLSTNDEEEWAQTEIDRAMFNSELIGDESFEEDVPEEIEEEKIEEEEIEMLKTEAFAPLVTDRFAEDATSPINEASTPFSASTEESPFFQKFSKKETTYSNQIALIKLDSLIGSFGLNERLQYINELFDGSSEALSEAIKSLDSLPDFEAALRKASLFAEQFQWDLSSETVEEFVLKINRRYA
jgi:hypothetical protein